MIRSWVRAAAALAMLALGTAVCAGPVAAPAGSPAASPATAGALLDEAGYPNGANGIRLTVKLAYDQTNDADKRSAEVVRDDLFYIQRLWRKEPPCARLA